MNDYNNKYFNDVPFAPKMSNNENQLCMRTIHKSEQILNLIKEEMKVRNLDKRFNIAI